MDAPQAGPAVDVLVVGAGLCGSAAARHLLALRPSLSVCLVGPGEAEAAAAEAFGQHGDEGRITRRIDGDPVWAKLAARSIERYAELETASGIAFHRPVGFLAVGHADGPFIRRSAAVAEAQQVPLQGPLPAAALLERFPYLAVADENVGLLEEASGAGLISPRALVEAQQRLFRRAGGRLLRDVVERLDLAGGELVEARLRSGGVLFARRALVCVGTGVRWRPLLPTPGGHLRPATTVVTQEVLRVAVGEEDAQALRGMPCVVCKFGAAAFGTATSFDSCYILPPVVYPAHGKAHAREYLKIGHGTWFECRLRSAADAAAWMRGDPGANIRDGVAAAEALRGRFAELLPGLLERSPDVAVDRCMWDVTPGMRPYVDALPGGRVALVAGGNGFAAKSSDELGRVAALLVIGEMEGSAWAYDIPRDAFAAAFEEELLSEES